MKSTLLFIAAGFIFSIIKTLMDIFGDGKEINLTIITLMLFMLAICYCKDRINYMSNRKVVLYCFLTGIILSLLSIPFTILLRACIISFSDTGFSIDSLAAYVPSTMGFALMSIVATCIFFLFSAVIYIFIRQKVLPSTN